MDILSKNLKQQQGSMLLETLIAVLIFSFGILGIVGLQGAMIRNSTDSKFRIDASYLANQVIGEMWVDKGNLAAYQSPGGAKFTTWQSTVKSVLPAGDANIVVAGTVATVTVTWQPPGIATAHNYVTVANINTN